MKRFSEQEISQITKINELLNHFKLRRTSSFDYLSITIISQNKKEIYNNISQN